MTGSSLDFTVSTNDSVQTKATNLLSLSAVAANGGQTFDVWFKTKTHTAGYQIILTDGSYDGLWLVGDKLNWNF